MALPLTELADIQLQFTTHLSTPKGRKAELAWLVDLYSGLFTHISGHPSSTGRAQDRESSPANAIPLCHATNHSQCCFDIVAGVDGALWLLLLMLPVGDTGGDGDAGDDASTRAYDKAKGYLALSIAHTPKPNVIRIQSVEKSYDFIITS